MIKNKKIILIFRICSFVFCTIALMAQFGVFTGNFWASSLLYYTVQSNIMIWGLFGSLIFFTIIDIINKNHKKSGASYHPKLCATVMLAAMVTLIIFWTVLAPQFEDFAFSLTFNSIGLHLISPLLILFDYIFFTQRGVLAKTDIWIFTIPPLGYYIQATILGFSGVLYPSAEGKEPNHFPYFFIDYYKSGWMVAVYVISIIICFLFLASLIIYFDNKYSSKKK
ncbi:MAG: Pr6Pr family membrane protein [Candidatus Improbicoccus devescovinae]|nr:MAG: Pr6Pr family membrane protein [Candidatus Improbicoccus devescovinae]